MAKNKRMKFTTKILLSMIPICIGIISLILSYVYYDQVDLVTRNLLDWFVGVGFVGGAVALLMTFIYHFVRCSR